MSRRPDRNPEAAPGLPEPGFTLIELVLVIAVAGLLVGMVGMKLGTFAYFREEGYLRTLAERLQFLHHQAVSDQSYYQIEFDLERGEYRVGILRTESDVNESIVADAGDQVGTLTLELADYLNPGLGSAQTIIPPPSYPSLAEPEPLPAGCEFTDIRTMRGKRTRGEGGKVYVVFSPRGFSEFSVVHLKMSGGNDVTVVVNPFTGTPEILREYKDFEWTYGRQT